MFNHLKFLILTPNSHEATNLNVNEKHICIYKGVIDILKYPINQEIKLVYDYTCNKRIGGQGDMLSGVLATFVSNCTKSTDEFVKVSVIGCKLMRYVSHLTFVQKGYTMITTDIFKHLNKSTIKFFNK
ncbi:NNRD [Hepatospora eriocheir]|uniref:NNRD n=1 Tax=Hepatospora eriocheir TaxID=1081669 RepID=A0A1X0QAD0_9MICR|nr:NNRD [Hepatospora eriocheir]